MGLEGSSIIVLVQPHGSTVQLGVNTSISKARQNLFSLADQAAKGEKVEFVHKGQVFQIVLAGQPSKLARIKPIRILPDGVTFDDLERAMKEMPLEIVAEWEKNNAL